MFLSFCWMKALYRASDEGGYEEEQQTQQVREEVKEKVKDDTEDEE